MRHLFKFLWKILKAFAVIIGILYVVYHWDTAKKQPGEQEL